MSSSEEYLDNLLKSLTEGGNNAGTNTSSSAVQDTAQAEEPQEVPAPEETDQTVSMDDIEAMFASMDAEPAAEEAQAGEKILADELSIDESTLSETSLLNDEILSDEPGLAETAVIDELVPDDGIVSDEMALDDSMVSDEITLDDSMVSDEIALDDGMMLDEMALDDSVVTDEAALDDGMVSDEIALDDGMMSDEMALDDSVVTDEVALDDGMVSDEIVLDDGMISDELALDDSMLSDDSASGDEGILDDSALSDEGASDDFALSDETMSDDSALDESASEDLSLEELGLAGLGLEDLGLEERGPEDFASEEEFGAEEDFALEEEPGTEMDFAIEEETEEAASGDGAEVQTALEEAEVEDADLSALLASMGGDDDLSEINDLLEKSDQGVAIDDDVMAMLDGMSDGEEGEDVFDFFAGEEEAGEEKAEEGEPENIREITPEELEERENPKTKKEKKKEEKERKKKEKQAKKNKGEGADEGGETPKEPGFFAKLIAFLLEEDDEDAESAESGLNDVGVVIGNLSDENKELLAELNAEDKQKAKKKDKKDKKEKKEKKDKKGNKKGGKAGADGEGAAKPKKPKKEKKKKEQSIEEELKLPVKKLSKKKVVTVFLFCATIAAGIIIVTMLLPEQMQKNEARLAYDQGEYTQVYDLLYGKNLSEEEEDIFQKSGIVLKMQRKLDSYENYRKLDMQLEALNALIEGVSRYRNLRDEADEYNVGVEVADIYGRILVELANNYGLTESDALDIISSEDNVTYSQRLQAVVAGESWKAEEEELPDADVMQDVLPEEEEILDRLQGTETE